MRKAVVSRQSSVVSKIKGVVLVVAFFALMVFGFAPRCLAEEVTILYSGETHGMIYHCNCPKEPDGGAARRAALIKELRKDNPNVLLLDTGGFFAGGLMDEYTQNTDLDKKRTSLNIKAMELMCYDAVNIGDDEFNFGWDFLAENINNTKIPFLSCNLKSEKVLPYVIKKVAGIKIGIFGVTPLTAIEKAQGLKLFEPKIASQEAVVALKKAGADIIVLLSHLGEDEDLKLIKDVEGIDIVISGNIRTKEEPFTKVDSTLILRPSWLGRRLGKASLDIENGKIAKFKVEELRLSDKIDNDPVVQNILPGCFSDANCTKKGFIGTCKDFGKPGANCEFSELPKVNLSVILPKSCKTCRPETIINYLKANLSGLTVSYLYYPEEKASQLISDLGVKALPVYLLDKTIEKEKAFSALKDNLEKKGDFYILKPGLDTFSYLLGREKINGKLDLFISLFNASSPKVLEVMRTFNPTVHFLAVANQGSFNAAAGNLEVEEYFRSVCVQKYYPESFFDYISCRALNINSSWWEDCLGKSDSAKIRTCARGEEAKELLRKNISLSQELQIIYGPVYLIDNLETFISQEGVPAQEDFKKLLAQ